MLPDYTNAPRYVQVLLLIGFCAACWDAGQMLWLVAKCFYCVD